jgi:hypothetical protein
MSMQSTTRAAGAADDLAAFLGASAVSWAAIIAGAATAASVSILLVSLASGLGLASVSPWQNAGVTATTFAISTGVSLIIVQWISAGLGGYMAGRLRTKWTAVHSDEVFFRDTAHGFLAWSVGTILTAVIFASAASSVVSGGARAVAGVASGAAQGAAGSDAGAYFVDGLFRTDKVDASTGSVADAKAEASRILLISAQNGRLAPDDRDYLARIAAARTGISKQDAEKRVDDTTTQAKAAADKAKEAADEARKATAKLSFYLFFSMLIGAFIASVGGAIGGQQRDDY